MYVSQGWTPVFDRFGSGRWSILSGSGRRHYRAHPPLHPGSCSQHLQCYADEPQLCSANTGAVQLAAPPTQVKTKNVITFRAHWASEKCNHTIIACHCQDIRRLHPLCPEEDQWVRSRGCPYGMSLCFLLADSLGGSAPLTEAPPYAAWLYRSRPRPRRDGGVTAGH